MKVKKGIQNQLVIEMMKYNKIPAYYKTKYYGNPDDLVYIEEKLDGGNIRFIRIN